AYLPQARRRYRNLLAVLLTVDAATLHRRLRARGRENEEEIRARLDRNASHARLADAVQDSAIMTLDNSGSPELAIEQLYRHLTAIDTKTPHNHAIDAVGHGQRQAGSRL